MSELDTVVALVLRKHARLVNLGHGRDTVSVTHAERFIEAWRGHGDVGHVVSWPAVAASWLRPACRFASGAPDVWVVAAGPTDWAGLGKRLAGTAWQARRTVAFSALATAELPTLAGTSATDGLSGATADGASWTFFDGRLRTGPWS
ncbi:MAG: hypothetical protein M3548_15445 [Actinomycetota bacterium]|nr:hypothetical protein [Actinomycetota bacterium]